MKSKKESFVAIHLTLSEREAQWLKAYMQNKVYDVENEEDAKYRNDLFTVLAETLN